jgi:carbon monoxide dehydrogenase subunit G
MPRLRETVTTDLPVQDTFDFIADFANRQVWDPGVAYAERVDAGPVGVGARYRLGVRMRGRVASMEYRITRHEPPARVVLTGEGSGVAAVDDIRFAPGPDGTGTVVDYTADIRLTGWMRLIEPFAGAAFAKVGRDAATGMQQTLADRAASATPATTGARTRTGGDR